MGKHPRMLIAQITDLHAGQRLEVEGQTMDTLEGVQRAGANLNQDKCPLSRRFRLLNPQQQTF